MACAQLCQSLAINVETDHAPLQRRVRTAAGLELGEFHRQRQAHIAQADDGHGAGAEGR